MAADLGLTLGLLRLDGNMATSNFTMWFQAEILNVEVIRPMVLAEITAAGAAYATGLAAGVWDTPVPENKLCALDIMSPASRLLSHAIPLSRSAYAAPHSPAWRTYAPCEPRTRPERGPYAMAPARNTEG